MSQDVPGGWGFGFRPMVSEVFPDESRVLTAGEDGLTIVWSMSGTRHIKLGPFDSPVLCRLAPWDLGEPSRRYAFAFVDPYHITSCYIYI